MTYQPIHDLAQHEAHHQIHVCVERQRGLGQQEKVYYEKKVRRCV